MPHSTQPRKEQMVTSTPESEAGVLVVRRHHLVVRCSHWAQSVSPARGATPSVALASPALRDTTCAPSDLGAR